MPSDIRLGARRLLKDRWFAGAAILVLGLGIAATNTAFTIVNGVLLRDMPFDDPDRIVQLAELSYPELREVRGNLRAFDDIAGAWEQPMYVADAAVPA